MEGTNRVTVQEAARLLGISEGAVRARIHRGTLETERDSGAVYVRINTEDTAKERTEQSELVEALREHNTALQRQLDAEREASAELRRIIAGLVQRVPELEPAPEPPESPEMAANEQQGRGPVPDTGGPQSETSGRSWLWWWAAWILSLVLLAPAMWVLVNLF
jgi:excisionase family DNA binding protein